MTIAVGDLPITATANNFDASAGVAQRVLVGTFKDSDAAGVAKSFAASIDWGDGTVTAGTIAKAKNGVFTVYATKTYAAKVSGAMPITLTVTGDLGALSTSKSVATVRTSAEVVGGTLNINGTSGDDKIGVSRKGSNYLVTVNGKTTSFATSTVTLIQALGLAGSDVIQVADSVFAATYLDGGDGNDAIFGGAGNDVINGGAGADTIFTGDGTNKVAGGDGNDTVTGGIGRDRITGGTGNDSLQGGAGRDILSGDEGNDIVVGGASSDTLYGGSGDDILNGLSGCLTTSTAVPVAIPPRRIRWTRASALKFSCKLHLILQNHRPPPWASKAAAFCLIRGNGCGRCNQSLLRSIADQDCRITLDRHEFRVTVGMTKLWAESRVGRGSLFTGYQMRSSRRFALIMLGMLLVSRFFGRGRCGSPRAHGDARPCRCRRFGRWRLRLLHQLRGVPR